MISKIRQLLHPKDFFAALWPYRYSSAVFGQCNAGSKKWQAIYAVFTTAVYLALSFSVAHGHTIIITAEGLERGQLLIAWADFAQNFIIPPILIWTWFFVGQAHYRHTVLSSTIIDQELMQVLHCRVNFRAMVTRQVVCWALLVFFYVTIVLSDSYVEMEPKKFDWGRICRKCAVGYISMIRVASCCAFGNMVVFTGDRYMLINRALKYADSLNNMKNKTGHQAEVITDKVFMVQKLRIIHGKLFFVSRRIISAFALQVLVCFLAYFIGGIADLYQFYLSQTSLCKMPLHRLLNFVTETVNDFGPVVYVVYSCHRTMRKGNEATQIMNSMVVYDEKLKIEASSFSHQLMHYQLQFSLFGLFRLNLTSLQRMIATMSLYLIIFIQLQPSSIKHDCTKQ